MIKTIYNENSDVSGINFKSYSFYNRSILTEAFIDKYKNKVNWFEISQGQKLSEKFIEKHQDKVYWPYISQFQILSETFIEKYQDEVYWPYISCDQTLSESFIEKHQDKVYWRYISRGQKLSETFIEKYQDKLDWNWISEYQLLSYKLLKKHENVINYNGYIRNKNINFLFIKNKAKQFKEAIKCTDIVDITDHILKRNCFYLKHLTTKELLLSVNDPYIDWNFQSMFKKLSKESVLSEIGIQYFNLDIIKKRYPKWF